MKLLAAVSKSLYDEHLLILDTSEISTRVHDSLSRVMWKRSLDTAFITDRLQLGIFF